MRRPGSGNAFVTCSLGHRHWGRYGAAGLLLRDGDDVLLQHRAPWTHEGGTWSVPGGARDADEDAVTTALRETAEETGVIAADVAPVGWSVADHGGWSYTTVVAGLAPGAARPDARAVNAESSAVRWWRTHDVDALAQHAGFAAAWPALRETPLPLTVVVDLANVMGSRPDGWWRDRAGAAAGWIAELAAGVRAGWPAVALPPDVDAGRLDALTPRLVVVREGAARAAGPPPPEGGERGWSARLLEVVDAPGSGDDTVTGLAAAHDPAGQLLVVTADRGLRARVRDAAPHAVLAGPHALPPTPSTAGS